MMVTKSPNKKDLFNRLNFSDIFERIDLPIEDKVIFSPEMKSLIADELRKEIASLPIGKILSSLVGKHFEELKKSGEDRLKKETFEISKKLSSVREELEKLINGLKDNIKEYRIEFKNDILSLPQYQFGGFSPQFNDLNIGSPETEGAWRIVKSGSNLSFQRLESNVWVEKGVMTA